METLPNQHNLSVNGSEDVKIDITESGKSDMELPDVAERQDTTEQSSSFGHTDSGLGSGPSSSDDEIDSKVHDDGTATMALDEYGDLFRKRRKKLTPHWRKFIRPLMWRCKWLELHMKELKSQALKYNKELAECDRKKQVEMEKVSSEDIAVKSMPYLPEDHRVKVMRRKKRKKVEEVTDVESYMKQHNLFSYYADEKRFPDYAYIDDDDCGNSDKNKSGYDEFIFNGELLSHKFADGDSVEHLYHMIRKIEAAMSRVEHLEVRVKKVSIHNASEFAPSDDTRFPAQNAVRKSVLGSGDGGKFSLRTLYPTSQHASENRVGVLMPESVVTGHDALISFPDMIESTDQPKAGPSCVKIESEIQIPIETEEDSHDSEVVMARSNGNSHMAVKGEDGVRNVRNLVTGFSWNTKLLREQSDTKTRCTRKRKGRRKARSKSRRSSRLSMPQN